jgi:hypothetical protein
MFKDRKDEEKSKVNTPLTLMKKWVNICNKLIKEKVNKIFLVDKKI